MCSAQGSIKENIRYGLPGATDEQVMEAAKQAYAHDFITQKTLHQYETDVGERGGQNDTGPGQAC